MQLSPACARYDESRLRWPDDDSYHAFIDPFWLWVLASYIPVATPLLAVRRSFYVMRSYPCA